MKAARRIVLEVVGWLLVVAGIAALVLPGPGLLLLASGLFVLSQQYEWAERRVDPILHRALLSAAVGVESRVKMGLSLLFALSLAAFGVLWVVSPPAPAWWPLRDDWWLTGGLAAGVTQIVSAVVALGLILWSYKRFHGHPEAVTELRRKVAGRDASEVRHAPP